ncbi:MAG: hypothetical protein M3P46_02815 [Actinomycetota bacterium]|nr:hypothetical protein [Actinomycetota bacterium]
MPDGTHGEPAAPRVAPGEAAAARLRAEAVAVREDPEDRAEAARVLAEMAALRPDV